MSTILWVRQNSKNFFVLAEKNFFMTNTKNIDASTKRPFPAEELNYAITELKDGKPKSFIGYVKSIEENAPCLLRMPKTTRASADTKEFKSTLLLIIQKIYEVE